jgi:hypothetical protein
MTLTQKIITLDDAAFERWLKRNGYSGLAAAKLAQKRREGVAA